MLLIFLPNSQSNWILVKANICAYLPRPVETTSAHSKLGPAMLVAPSCRVRHFLFWYEPWVSAASDITASEQEMYSRWAVVGDSLVRKAYGSFLPFTLENNTVAIISNKKHCCQNCNLFWDKNEEEKEVVNCFCKHIIWRREWDMWENIGQANAMTSVFPVSFLFLLNLLLSPLPTPSLLLLLPFFPLFYFLPLSWSQYH